jgi:cellulose synthase/poly-beta-1,6-N-acetylglucosamine synthase-like glycosyltransferase
LTEAWVRIAFVLAVVHFTVANLIALLLLASSYGSVRRRWQRTRRGPGPDLAPSPLTLPLSVVVPAFNEQDVVVDSVLAVLDSAVPDLEVIVVDDGSSDETVSRLREAFDMAPVRATHPEPLRTRAVEALLRSRSHPNVWLIGKADALNAGVNLARYRFVLLTDADSVFEPGALLAAMTAIGFDAGAHVGVGGMVRVRNGMTIRDGRLTERRLPRSLLGLFQVVEYMGTMTGSRAGWNAVNGVPVLSGAFSIWRRDVVLELGGMSHDTTHEDLEFTLRAHEHFRRRGEPYRITTLADAVVWTEAPHRWGDLYRQRKRWQRVVYECIWRYRKMIGNPRYGEVGTVTMPYMLVFEALGPFVEAAAFLLVLVLLAWGTLSLLHLGLFLVFSAALVALTRIVAVAIDTWLYGRFPPRAMLRLSCVALLEPFLYRPLILAARLMAFPEFVSGRRTWERARREPREVAHA